MTLVEFFSFLPFGKYAFYIWFAYLTTFVTIAFLFIHSAVIHKQARVQLRAKYLRIQK